MDGTGKGRAQGSFGWRKSSHSGPQGNCVEVAVGGAMSYSHGGADGTPARLARAGWTVLAEVLRGFIGS